MENGLSAAIMNPYSLDMMKAYYTFCALEGLDDNCSNYITFAESIGVNWLLKEGKDIPIEIEIKAQQMLDDVWSVEAYPADTMVYLYVFLADDITYTFIAPDRNSGFFMYALEQ